MLAGKGITAAQSHVLMYVMEHNGEPVFSTAMHHDRIFPCDGIRAYKKLRAGEDISLLLRAVMMTSVTEDKTSNRESLYPPAGHLRLS